MKMCTCAIVVSGVHVYKLDNRHDDILRLPAPPPPAAATTTATTPTTTATTTATTITAAPAVVAYRRPSCLPQP